LGRGPVVGGGGSYFREVDGRRHDTLFLVTADERPTFFRTSKQLSAIHCPSRLMIVGFFQEVVGGFL
jgi:hypothetical protein